MSDEHETAKYRLTEHGRVSVELILEHGLIRDGDTLLAGGAAVDLPDHWVEPVPPPLPPEPEPGAYLIGEFFALRRDGAKVDDRWLSISFAEGGHRWSTWDELAREAGCPGVQIQRLRPAPEPVTLPWHGQSHLGRDLAVAVPSPSRYRLVPFAVGGTAATVEPAVARAMAAALLTAADQAEAVDRG